MKSYIFRDETMKGAKDQEWFERGGKATGGQTKFISGGTPNDSSESLSRRYRTVLSKRLNQSVAYWDGVVAVGED